MRYLAILFFVYIAILAVMPCQDAKEIYSSSNQVSVHYPESGTDHPGDDACPPFCSCTCCSVSRDVISTADIGIVVQPTTVPYSDYKMAALPEQSLDIYQPPQIA